MQPIVYRNSGDQALPYRLLKPDALAATKKYPLIVFLHGAGERGNDNEKQLVHGANQIASHHNREKYPCFFVAPQCPLNQKWADVDWTAPAHALPQEATVPARLTIELVEQFVSQYPVDPDRVYITGLSMGGFGVWDLLARYPGLFAAAVPICGGADETTADRFMHVPIWAFHGAQDEVIKPARSRNIVEALRKAGGTPKYTEYPNVGHHSWEPAYNEPKLFEWLFAQKRK